MIMTRIISAFPGTGKSYFHRNSDSKVLDSDSSQYSWIEEGVRNPDFPNNYIAHIKGNIGDADFILVSSHEVVRTALVTEGIEYTLVFPEISLKEEYVERFRQRGSPQAFVDLLEKNWDSWITELEKQSGCTHVKLKQGQYLSDILR